MEALQLLRNARELISDPARWTRGAGGRNMKGTSVAAADPSAVRFCAIGAVVRASGTPGVSGHHDAFTYLTRGFGIPAFSSIPVYNDTHDHDDVLRGFDRAIALAEEDTEGAPLPALNTAVLIS